MSPIRSLPLYVFQCKQQSGHKIALYGLGFYPNTTSNVGTKGLQDGTGLGIQVVYIQPKVFRPILEMTNELYFMNDFLGIARYDYELIQDDRLDLAVVNYLTTGVSIQPIPYFYLDAQAGGTLLKTATHEGRFYFGPSLKGSVGIYLSKNQSLTLRASFIATFITRNNVKETIRGLHFGLGWRYLKPHSHNKMDTHSRRHSFSRPSKKTIMNITLQQAETIISAAKSKAMEIKVPMNIAVIDRGGNLVAFVRMDGAWLGSRDIAIKKAQTANYFDMNSEDLGKLSQPGEALYGIEISNGGLISFGGGILLKDGSKNIIGAIGVSGGQVKQDIKVAEAGVEALK